MDVSTKRNALATARVTTFIDQGGDFIDTRYDCIDSRYDSVDPRYDSSDTRNVFIDSDNVFIDQSGDFENQAGCSRHEIVDTTTKLLDLSCVDYAFTCWCSGALRRAGSTSVTSHD